MNTRHHVSLLSQQPQPDTGGIEDTNKTHSILQLKKKNTTHSLFKVQREVRSISNLDPQTKAESNSNTDHLWSTCKLPDSVPGTLLLPVLPRPGKAGIRRHTVYSKEL